MASDYEDDGEEIVSENEVDRRTGRFHVELDRDTRQQRQELAMY